MKNIKDYFFENYILNEKKFDTADFFKHDYKYLRATIDKIITGKDVLLGVQGEDGKLLFDKPIDIDEFKSFVNNLSDKTVDDFDSMVRKYLKQSQQDEFKKLSIWRKIWKGKHINKGINFENYFVENYGVAGGYEYWLYSKGLITKEMIGKTYATCTGGLNRKRSIWIPDDEIKMIEDNVEKDLDINNIDFYEHFLSNDFNVGTKVVDVLIKEKDTNKDLLYLSLKKGNTVTFINLGIKDALSQGSLQSGKLTPKGKLLCELFNLDPKKLNAVFANYDNARRNAPATKKEIEENYIDITNHMLKNKKLLQVFLKNVIGYGYIMVYGKTEDDLNPKMIDLREESTMNKLISDFEFGQIQYGGKKTHGKLINIILKFKHMDMLVDMRNVQSQIYPDTLHAYYHIDESFYK